uniref:DNA ligase OB-like domain-containing protein n=1 Tax=Anophryoides haemophila TaxID=46462 RepID=A0A7S3IB89_9CILI|mmetsp:Transcript_14754/g.2131  ORF Transcript_14754/g.2131 Transcript_14754/m.2131 type:complete len:105 (+) Transcript_14754:109-423(+)
MLRDPESLYDRFRSNSLLKVKVMHDEEAVVIGYEAGSRSYAGLIGAIRVKDVHGVEFKIGGGFTDAQRKKPPKKGSTVTFKYQNKTPSGKYRFPIFLREHPGKL